jgi:hypothetical protein
MVLLVEEDAHAYRKLYIRSRADRADALAA